ncbi:BACON domain-containing protein [Flavobacterium geliluteum]|uniref:BACON domain-containing protein n=1 Tax=Flavobacterium geliluteum TaxID=2816120 RepID=A0A941AX73_9FLAO|nr:BACON domain-containing protein [Flavobacterium geliluteum]MBP4137681.1 BACON domain-containing protein [Flavobacterium geliluteum]
MSKTCVYFTFLLIGFSMISCDRNEDGKADDDIKLSKKDIIMESSQSSYTVETRSTDYWLNEIFLDGKATDLSTINNLDKNWIVVHPEYQVERKEDGKKIVITMNKNNSNADRILMITLQHGNYFDGIRVTQKK